MNLNSITRSAEGDGQEEGNNDFVGKPTPKKCKKENPSCVKPHKAASRESLQSSWQFKSAPKPCVLRTEEAALGRHDKDHRDKAVFLFYKIWFLFFFTPNLLTFTHLANQYMNLEAQFNKCLWSPTTH